MAILLINTSESGQTNGTTITTGNSGGGAGNAWDTVTIGSGCTATFTTTAIRGSDSMTFTSGGTSAASRVVWNSAGALGGTFSRLQGRIAIKPGNLTPAQVAFVRFQAGGSQCARFTVDSTGTIRLRDQASGSIAATVSAGTITTSDTWYVTFDITFGSSGSGTINYYHSKTATSPDETLTFSAANLLSTAIDEVDFGISASAANASVTLDDIIITDSGTIPGMPSQTGTAAGAFGALSATGAGHVNAFNGHGTGTFGSLSATGAGTITPLVQGTAAGALHALTATGAGTINSSTVMGLAAAHFGSLTANAFHPLVVSGVATGSFGRLTGGALVAAPTFLYTPPQRINTFVYKGTRSLTGAYPVSETVWKDANGVWQHRETPASDDLLGAQILLAVSGRPVIVSAQIAAELIAAGIGTVEETV